MTAVLAATPDPAAIARLSELPPYNAQLRTTCVATRLDGGHAENALPQLARATINCRLLPGDKVDDVKATLVDTISDAGIPTYGHTGLAGNIFDVRAHGRDERVSIKAFDNGVEYLYELVTLLAS